MKHCAPIFKKQCATIHAQIYVARAPSEITKLGINFDINQSFAVSTVAVAACLMCITANNQATVERPTTNKSMP